MLDHADERGHKLQCCVARQFHAVMEKPWLPIVLGISARADKMWKARLTASPGLADAGMDSPGWKDYFRNVVGSPPFDSAAGVAPITFFNEAQKATFRQCLFHAQSLQITQAFSRTTRAFLCRRHDGSWPKN